MAALEQSHPLSQGLTNQKVKASNVMRRGNQAVVLPHQRGFASMTNWLSKTYRFTFDEALKRDYNTAKAMQNDAFIQGLLRNRILPTAKSQWKIKATGPGASEEIERFYESALKQIPLWHDFRRNLLMSVWHGRYGVQFATDSISHDYRKFYYQGRPINTISHWVPHSGDKITFTWDGVPGIRINAMYVSDWKTRYGATVLSPDDARLAREANSYRWTEEGPIMLLDTPEVRRKFAIPVFEVTDAPWDEPDMAGGVRGIGLRHYAFWCWDQRQEVVGWAMLHLEDFGAGGYTVIGYDGKEALQRNMAAFDNPETRVIHVPIIPGNDERITDQVTRLTPAGEGNDAIFQWAEQYFNAHLTILFTGHPLNSQAAPTGMGSEMAGKSTDILKSIQRSDAEVSDGSMTQEVLPVIQEANGHDPAQCQLEFISEIRESDKESGMKAAKAHFDMGGKVGKRYSHMLSDVPEVEDGEDYLQSPQFRQMEQQEALMAQGIMPTDEEGNPTQQTATPALNKGASKALKERGSQHASKLAGTFPAGKRVTLDEARQALASQGVPDEDHLSAITWGVSTAAVIEHDEIDGVAYSRGPGAWPDSPVSYSTEGIDPASKWEAIPAPRSGGTRWRNIDTGTITYVQPGAGRSVQGLPGDKASTGKKLDKAQGDTEDVALLPGKGIATSGVEQHISMLAEGGSKIAGEAGVLDAVRHVDKRLLKKQTVALAGRLGLGVSSRTSKTEALAYIEDTLRAKSKEPAGGTGTGADKATNQTAMTDLPGEGVTKGTPPTVSKEAPPRGGDKAEATVKGDDGVEYPASAVTQDKAGNSFVTVPEGSGPVKSPVTGGTFRAGQKMPIARSAEFKKQAAGDQATDTTATVKEEPKQIAGKRSASEVLKTATRKAPWGGDAEDPVAKEILQSKDATKLLEGVPDVKGVAGAGASSMVLDSDDGNVHRIGPKAERPKSDNVLQPTQVNTSGDWMHEVLPKVKTEGITEEHVEQMKQSLAKEGLEFHDAGTDNLGITAEGKLVVIDAGAVRPASTKPREDGESLKGYMKRIGKDEHHDSLRDYARSKHRQEKDTADYHNSAIKQAVEGLAREQGTKTFNMTQARKEGDYTTIPGFDTVAESVAANHPGLFGGVDAGHGTSGEETGLAQDHAQKLWGMLTEGKKPYRTIREHEDEAIAEHHEAGWPSIEQDADDPRGAGESQEPEDADTSFDFGGNQGEATETTTGATRMDAEPVEAAQAHEPGEKTEESTMGGKDGFMQQEKAGRWNESHIEGMAGQSFTNDKGLTVDLRKEDDGTWSVGSQKGLTQAGAAQHLNKIGAEPAQSLFGADVQAQGDTKKPAEKLQWSEPAKKKDDGAALPGMRDAFAPGMFGAAANQSDEPEQTATAEPGQAPPHGGEVDTEKLPPGVSRSAIPLSVATAAHRGTSHVPEKRGKQRQDDYINQMQSDFEHLQQYAKTDEAKQLLQDEFTRYAGGYAGHYKNALQAASRTMSSMIAGPANFPVERNRKRMETERKRYDDLHEFRERALRAIRKKLAPETLAIQAGQDNAVELLQKKAEDLQKKQDTMKQANAHIRKAVSYNRDTRQVTFNDGHSLDSLKEKLSEVGLGDHAEKLIKPDFAGRIGFPDYELTNNNANLKRIKGRIESVSKMKAGAAVSKSYSGGVTVEESPEDARIRIKFPGKPERDKIEKLKKNGFRWSPSEGAWQRQLNNAGRYAVESVLQSMGHELQPQEAPEEDEDEIPDTIVSDSLDDDVEDGEIK